MIHMTGINDKIKYLISTAKEITTNIESVYEDVRETCKISSPPCDSNISKHEGNRKIVALFGRFFDTDIDDIANCGNPAIMDAVNALLVMNKKLDRKWKETDDAVRVIKGRIGLS